jgi:hypothetical protein
MAKWNYTLCFGKELREAIDDENIEMVTKCLIACFRELLNKMSDDDKDLYEDSITDYIEELEEFVPDDEDEDEEYGNNVLNHILGMFYDICDDVRAWVEV